MELCSTKSRSCTKTGRMLQMFAIQSIGYKITRHRLSRRRPKISRRNHLLLDSYPTFSWRRPLIPMLESSDTLALCLILIRTRKQLTILDLTVSSRVSLWFVAWEQWNASIFDLSSRFQQQQWSRDKGRKDVQVLETWGTGPIHSNTSWKVNPSLRSSRKTTSIPYKMCIEVTYRALCGHYTSPVYDFCHTANEQSKSRTRGLTMHLWRWSGRHHDRIDCLCKRVQPCKEVRVKRKKDDPYWNKRVCERCQKAVNENNKRAGILHKKLLRSHR